MLQIFLTLNDFSQAFIVLNQAILMTFQINFDDIFVKKFTDYFCNNFQQFSSKFNLSNASKIYDQINNFLSSPASTMKATLTYCCQ